jgi:hypothetical protein
MKFVNREREMKFLEESKRLTEKKLFTLSVYGNRRVGKTRLLLEFIGDNDLYFFVNKDKTSITLLKEFERTLKEKKLLTNYETLSTWDDFFEVIFDRFEGIIVFDEFQNFWYVDKSVFGILQKIIDLNENKKKNLLIIFCGSVTGLLKELFSRKQPLYGRIKRSLKLKPLSIKDAWKMGKEVSLDFETFLQFYAIFGGYPRYYVAVEDESLYGAKLEKILERFFFHEPAVFEDEVNAILSMEFGKRKGVYYDILSSVAQGCRTLSEISNFLSKKQTSITRHISELFKKFEYLKYEKQAIGNKKLIEISHPLIEFWMKYFHPDLSLYLKRDKGLIEKIKRDLNAYIGRKFEKICMELLETGLISIFNFTKIGKQWGKIPGTKETYEIDILALNEKTKQILFCECKWQNRVNAKKICKESAEKANYVQWNNEKRKEYFAIFAKSFSRKIEEFEGRKVFCFDLKDLEKFIHH